MPITTTIISRKNFNQFTNLEDFSANLSDFTENQVGNTPEKLKFISQLEITWIALASPSDPWTISEDSGEVTVTRATGSFIDDGFWIGSKCDIVQSGFTTFSPPSTIEIDIETISQDGKTITFTPLSGSFTDAESDSAALLPIAADASNALTALIYGFGILGENETYNKRSKVSQNTQEYYFAGLSVGGGKIDGIAKGVYNDWVTGSMTAERLADADDYTQVFEIEHIYQINPAYLEGQLSNLQDGIEPDLFTNSSLKYAFDVDFRTVLTNPNKSIKAVYDTIKGSTGWFNESANGFDNNYNIKSIAYEDAITTDAVEGLQISSRTKATITVEKLTGSFSAGQRAGLFVQYLASQSEYQNTKTTQAENFIFDSIYHNEGDATEVGAGVIKSFDSSIVSGELVIEAEFEYTTAQQLRLITDSNYYIAVQVADSALSAGNTDKVNLLADVGTYQKGALIEGLAAVTDFGYLVYGNDVDFDSGTPIISEAWNEDAILAKGSFNLDLASDKLAVLNSIEFALVAFNASQNSYFLLDNFFIDTSAAVVSEGVQQIAVSNNRGYDGLAFDDFNQVTITTGTKSGDLQSYDFKIGQRLRWQDWQPNTNADTVFFDNTKPQSNLNFKSSNYSGLEGYEIKVLMIFNSEGLNDLGQAGIGLDIYEGGDITVKDYGDSDTAYAIAEVKTLDPTTEANLEGAVYQNKPTLVQSQFTFAGSSVSNQLVVHRYEKTNQLGGILNEVQADLSVSGGLLIAKTLLSNTLFESGVSYNFTSRIYNPFETFRFTTKWNTAIDGAFDPLLIGGVKTWVFGNDSVTATSPNYLGSYLDGTEKQVIVICPDFSLITEIEMIDYKIVGDFDTSLFDAITVLSVERNEIETLLLEQNTAKTITSFRVFSNDFGIDYELNLFDKNIIHDGEVVTDGMDFKRLTTGTGNINRMQSVATGGKSLKELDLSNSNITGLLTINADIGVLHRLDTLIFKPTGNAGTTASLVKVSLLDIDLANCYFNTYNVSRNNIATNLTLGSEPHDLFELEAAVFTSLLTIDLGGAIVNDTTTSVRFRSSSLASSIIDDIYNQLDSAYDGISDLSGLIIDTSFNDAPTAASSTARSNLATAGATIIT